MPVEDDIHAKLMAAFSPDELAVENDSDRHAGHAGGREAGAPGESHFNVVIVAAAFAGVSRVMRQRMVYDVLKTELAGPVHALSVKAKMPGE